MSGNGVLGTLKLVLEANRAEWETDMKRIAKSTEEMSESMKKFGETTSKAVESAKHALEAFAAFEVLKHVVEECANAESAFKQMSQTITSTGAAAGVSAKQVDELSEKLSRMSGIDKDAINSMESVLLTFTAIGKDALPRASQAVLDLSQKLGLDLKQAAIQVGKAMNDPVKGMTSLRREGVNFTEAQVDMVKGLVATGNSMEAQKIILKELETEFGGAAAAARDTLGGAFKQLNTDVNDFFKAVGASDMGPLRQAIEIANVAIETFTDEIKKGGASTNGFVQAMIAMGKGTIEVITWTVQMIKNGINDMIYLFQLGINVLENLPLGIGKMFKTWEGDVAQTIPIILGYMQKLADPKLHADNVFAPMEAQMEDSKKKAFANMDELAKAHANYKPGGGADSGEDASMKAIKEAAKEKKKAIAEALAEQKKLVAEIEREKKAADGVLASFEAKTKALKNQLAGTKEITDYEVARKKIMDQAKLSDAEKEKRLKQLVVDEKERLKVVKEIAIADDGKRLDSILDKEKQKLEELKNELAGHKELNVLEQAQKSIDDAIKAGKQFTVEKQKEILATAQQILDTETKIKQQQGIDSIEKITKSMQEQAQEAQLKLAGQEALIPQLKAEQQIRDEMAKAGIAQDDPQALALIAQEQQAAQATRDANDAIQHQKDVVDYVTASTESWRAKSAELFDLLNKGEITQAQYREGIKKVGEEAKKAGEANAKWVSSVEKSFDKAIDGGEKLSKIFKDLLKDLIKLAAQQLLFKPLENWLAGGAQGGIGGIGGPIGGIWKTLTGTRAGGGPVDKGGTYLVGEKGPELLTMDQGSSGHVTPNHELPKGAEGMFPGRAMGGAVAGTDWRTMLGGGMGNSSGGGSSSSGGSAGPGGTSGKMRPPEIADFLKIWQDFYHAQFDDFTKRHDNGDKNVSWWEVSAAQETMRKWDGYTDQSATGFQFNANGMPGLMARYPGAFGNVDPSVLNWFKNSGVPNLLPGFPAQPMSPLGGDGGDASGGGTIPTDGSYGPVNPNGNSGQWTGDNQWQGTQPSQGPNGTGTTNDGSFPGSSGKSAFQSFSGDTSGLNQTWNGGGGSTSLTQEIADAVSKGIANTMSPFSGEGAGNRWWDPNGDLSAQTPGQIPGIDQVPSNIDNNPETKGSTPQAYEFFKNFLDNATGDQIQTVQNAYDQFVAHGGSAPIPNWLIAQLSTAGNIPSLSQMRNGQSGLPAYMRGYAEGGRPTPGQPAMIGENGPELWVPDTAGTIIPHGGDGTGSGDNKHVNVTVHNYPGMDEPEITRNGSEIEIHFNRRHLRAAQNGHVQSQTAAWTNGQPRFVRRN